MNDIVTEHPAPAEAPEAPPPAPRRAAAKRAAREERLARVALEFQPDAIEIERRPPPLGARASLYLLLAFIVCMVVWAGVSNVERIVTARGKLVTSAPTMVVQPLDTSVVRSVRVTPGQVVRKGDILATLDPTFTEADVSTLQGNLSAYAAQIWRLQAEVESRPFKAADAGDSHDAQLQESIHVKRTAEFRARLRAMDERISGLEAVIRNAQEQRRLLSERLGTLREVEAIRTELFEKQRSSRITMLDARNARLQVERDLDAVTGKAEEARFDLSSARAEREALDQEWRQQAAQQLADARREYNAILSQLEKAQRRNEMVQLEAPADGIVLEVADRSVGSVIRQAEAIVTLVPLEVPLEAEAMIDARDIGNIHAEADVRIKLDAFPYQKHGTLRGVLRTVSEDAFTDRERRGEQSFYRARISLAPGELSAVSPDFRLIPGMAVTAEIKVGERTILSYFLYPLMRGLDESIREP